ncbi:PQQ-binding-like beta-propeller repeat protein [Paenibacillus dokdonensis]|uniref:PQQ-binding-like beta-propeller repeat protein n=1 Tax=Paenibacillus dokdonensis TaxID=2567944 RepID=A0ABU6GFU7_9BACL|nr:PQQ-binding-like beta-propeller repeat protein [Paenibacillus dokdonensis]MEC0238333.1 PQQ-binding-like beta-propeller repeat protein [Paenibacillus dokdonensis]
MMRKWTMAAAGLLLAGTLGSVWTGSPASAQTSGPNASYSSPGSDFYSTNPVTLAKPKWTAILDAPKNSSASNPSAVTAGQGRVYYIAGGKLIAKAVATGKTLWSFGTGLGDATLAGTDGTKLYVGAKDGSVYRVDAATGKGARIYRAPSGQAPSIFVDGGSLYVFAGGSLISVDLATGKEKWRNQDGKSLPQRVGGTLLSGAVESGAITVYTTYAIDPATGKTLWRLSGDHSGLLQAEGDKLYFQDQWPNADYVETSANIDEVDLKTGKITASKKLVAMKANGSPVYPPSKVVMDGNDVYAAVAREGVYRFNYDADPAVVKPELIADRGEFIAGPYNGKLFFLNDDNRGIHARKVVDRSQVYYNGPDNPATRIDMIESGLYVGQSDGTVYALNVSTGNAVFRAQTAARSYGAFQIESGMLLVQAEGQLYAYPLPSELMKPVSTGSAAGAFVKSDAKVTLDGKALALPAGTGVMTTDNRMFIPFRSLTEALGAKIAYDVQTKRTTVTYGSRVFSIADGSPFALIDGKQVALTYSPATLSGSLYVPIKDFGDLLGVQVKWNGVTRTVEVTKGAAAAK